MVSESLSLNLILSVTVLNLKQFSVESYTNSYNSTPNAKLCFPLNVISPFPTFSAEISGDIFASCRVSSQSSAIMALLTKEHR